MLVNLIQRKSLLICLLFISIFNISSAYAQIDSVTATVDKNPAMADESIVLTVVAFGSADGNEFDPSVLSDNFVVGRTSVSTQTRVVNFDTTRSTTWSTVLIPRQQGTFEIPAFDVGGKQTQPITMRILPISAVSQNKAREAFITAEVDVGQPFVQQMVKYKVKIHLATSLQRGTMSEPVLENADINPIGKDTDYSEIVDGQRYRVIERNYAIIPQSSGQVTIKGPLFEGEVIDRTQNSFSYFNQTRPLNRVAPDVVLDVQPTPADFDGQWLPSEFVQINEEWQPALTDIKVGEPITRTLTLSALGVSEQQLPEISGKYPPDFKVYPDQPSTTTISRDNNVIAQRVENIAIIPNRAGQFVLPPVKVAWFNTLTKQTEYAELPARSIEVSAAAQSSQSTPPPVQQTPVKTDDTTIDLDTNTSGQIAPTIETIEVTSFWSISSWILLALWIMTLIVWWFSRKFSGKSKVVTTTIDPSESASWKSLKSALTTHEASEIYPALLLWQSTLSEADSVNLMDHHNFTDSELQEELKSMFASQYAQGDKSWKSDTLLALLVSLRQQILKNKNRTPSLQPLFATQKVAP